jgi:hypothetical protein
MDQSIGLHLPQCLSQHPHTHLGEDIGRAAAYDIALLDIFGTAMAGYAHELAVAKAEGVTDGFLRITEIVDPR